MNMMPEIVRHPIKRFGKHVDKVGSDPRSAAANRAPKKVWMLGAALTTLATLGVVGKLADFREGGARGVWDTTWADFENAFGSNNGDALSAPIVTTVPSIEAPETAPVASDAEQTYYPVVECIASPVSNTVDNNKDYVSLMIAAENPGLDGQQVMYVVNNQFGQVNPGVDPDYPGVGAVLAVPSGCEPSYGP
jgi:hypothetical protein